MSDSGCPDCRCEACPCSCNHCDCCGHMDGLEKKFKLSMCAGQAFKIRPIVRTYRYDKYYVLPKERAFK